MGTLPIGIRKNWLTYFKYEEVRDTPRETRNILLIIFTLVAVVTFQAGVNPPAIYASDEHAYYVFLIFNSLAFFNSIFVILLLTHKFPFHFEIWAATVSMAMTFGSALFAISPKNSIDLILIIAAGPLLHLPSPLHYLYRATIQLLQVFQHCYSVAY
ncbi:hypothetical protein AAZX31_18G228400 [Glycine max]